MRFWDSSALVPLLVRESRSPIVENLLRHDSDLIVWWAAEVECASAVQRLRREGAFSLQQATSVLDRLAALAEAANLVQPSDGVRIRALRLLRVHPLRAADSLHLAAALLWARDQPSGREFACLDDRLRSAAATEGFHVVPLEP